MKFMTGVFTAAAIAIAGLGMATERASALPATSGLAGPAMTRDLAGSVDAPAVEKVQLGCVFPLPCVGPRYYGPGYYGNGYYYRGGPYYRRGYYYRGGRRYYRR